MTAPGHSARTARPAVARAFRVLPGACTALLVLLLSLMPGTASAHPVAGTPGGSAPRWVKAPAAGPVTAVAQRQPRQVPVAAAEDAHGRHGTLPPVLCRADGPGGSRDSGCALHRRCAQDAVLPDGGPQPLPAPLPRLITPRPVPAGGPRGPLPGSDRAPDLHVLQVHRN